MLHGVHSGRDPGWLSRWVMSFFRLFFHGIRCDWSILQISTSLLCTTYTSITLLFEQLPEPLAAFIRVVHACDAPSAVAVAPWAIPRVAVLNHVLAFDMEAAH